MDDHIIHIHKKIDRNKYVIYTILAFLALLTYLLVTVAQQVGNEASLTYESKASSLHPAVIQGGGAGGTSTTTVGSTTTVQDNQNQQEQQQNPGGTALNSCSDLILTSIGTYNGNGFITGCLSNYYCKGYGQGQRSNGTVTCGGYGGDPNGQFQQSACSGDCRTQAMMKCGCIAPTSRPTPTAAVARSCPNIYLLYKEKMDVNGSQRIGCYGVYYCDGYPGASGRSSGTVECGYTPRVPGEMQYTFNPDQCAKADCEAKAKTACGCAAP